MRALRMLAGAGVLAVIVGAVAWYFLTQSPPAAPEARAAPVEAAAPAGATEPPAALPAGAAEPVAVAAPADDDLGALQRRLDALARAYNERDVAGLERAMWRNHAVVRPTGETMYRADLLGQWAREWTDFKSHELGFVVELIEREGPVVTAVWNLTLAADLVDAQGTVHKMEITGSQKASYQVNGEDWVLEGPITYVGFERTIDGDPWPLGVNGR